MKNESYECLNSYELLNKYFILRFLLAVLMWEFSTMHRDASVVYYKTRLQKYGSWSVSRNLNIKPCYQYQQLKQWYYVLSLNIEVDSTAIVTIEQENFMMLCVSCVSSYSPSSPAAGWRRLNPDIFGCIVRLVFAAYLKLGWKLHGHPTKIFGRFEI